MKRRVSGGVGRSDPSGFVAARERDCRRGRAAARRSARECRRRHQRRATSASAWSCACGSVSRACGPLIRRPLRRDLCRPEGRRYRRSSLDQLGQRADAQAVAVGIQPADVEQRRRESGGARAGDVDVIEIADVHRRRGVARPTARARSERSADPASRRPSWYESKITSNDVVSPSRSNARCSVPFAFDSTTRRSPPARSAASAGSTSSGTVSQRLYV